MKKEIMGIEIENLSASQAVRRAMGSLREETLGICEILRAEMFLQAEKQEEYRNLLDQLTLGIIGDEEILRAVGEDSSERQKEVAENLFLKQMLEALSEDKRTVAVLTDTEAEKNKTTEFLKSNYPSLPLAGGFSMELSDDADDAVNHINGLDAEVVLAKLSSPEQEEFIFANRGKLSISLWLGVGKETQARRKAEKVPGFLEKILMKRMFKKKVTQYQDVKN